MNTGESMRYQIAAACAALVLTGCASMQTKHSLTYGADDPSTPTMNISGYTEKFAATKSQLANKYTLTVNGKDVAHELAGPMSRTTRLDATYQGLPIRAECAEAMRIPFCDVYVAGEYIGEFVAPVSG